MVSLNCNPRFSIQAEEFVVFGVGSRSCQIVFIAMLFGWISEWSGAIQSLSEIVFVAISGVMYWQEICAHAMTSRSIKMESMVHVVYMHARNIVRGVHPAHATYHAKSNDNVDSHSLADAAACAPLLLCCLFASRYKQCRALWRILVRKVVKLMYSS